MQVTLYKYGKPYSRRVSRLVLTTFCREPLAGECAAHLNGIITDNRLINLAWATVKENDSHKDVHGTRPRGHKCYQAKLTAEDVEFIRANYKLTKTFPRKSNVKELQTRFSVTGSTIFNALYGRTYKLKETK